MKRLIMKRPELPILAALAAVLLVGYQNCSNKMSFDGSDAAGKLAIGGPSSDLPGDTIPGSDIIGDNNPPNTGDGTPSGPTIPGGTNPMPNPATPTPTTPIGMLPTPGNQNDDNTPIDIDHTGKKIVFACSTGAEAKLMSEDDLKKASDLSLSNVHASLIFFTRPLRYVSLSNLHGSLAILNAWKITDASNIEAGDRKKNEISYLRAYEIQSASNVHGRIATELTALKMGNVSNIHGGSICASANSFDSFSNLHGAFIKIRGRLDGTANATANDISNVHALFTSIYKVNMKSISNIHSDEKNGEIIIRDSVIDDMSNVHGGLTLINSRVKNLSNFHGVLRMLNSQIDAQSNTDYEEEPVLTTK